MLSPIPDLPAGVVGVEASGRVTADDYEAVLIPAIEAAREAGDGRVRLLYVLGEGFDGYTPGAAWQDTRLGLGHLRSWERIAVVTDADWMRHMVGAMGWMIPGEVRVFPLAERDAAQAWLTG